MLYKNPRNQSKCSEEIQPTPSSQTAETLPLSPEEEQASVHTLIQKFSSPQASEQTASTSPHEEQREHVDTKPISSESTVYEHYEYQPATQTHQETSIHAPAIEELAQQINKEKPSVQGKHVIIMSLV